MLLGRSTFFNPPLNRSVVGKIPFIFSIPIKVDGRKSLQHDMVSKFNAPSFDSSTGLCYDRNAQRVDVFMKMARKWHESQKIARKWHETAKGHFIVPKQFVMMSDR